MTTDELVKLLRAEYNQARPDRVKVARLINQADRESILDQNYGPIHPDYEDREKQEQAESIGGEL